MASLIPRPVRALLILVAIVLGISLAWVWELRRQASASAPAAALPVLTDTVPFVFPDASGAPYDSTNLAGRIWIANLFFTTCPSICPMLMGNLSTVFATFGGDPRLHIASFSVDPEQDTPPVLTAYAAQRGIASPHWHLLTGELTAIEKFSVEGLRIGTLEEPLTHSQHVVLVDGLGRIRGYYDGLDPLAIRRLTEDAHVLLAEPVAPAGESRP